MTVAESLAPRPGLRVLVTAGASGIGKAIAQGFHACGAEVHVCDIDDEALRGADYAAGKTRCDVSDHDAVGHLVSEARETLGGLDVVVNNAGIAGPTLGIEDVSSEDWKKTIDINLNGQFNLAHHTVPDLKDTGGLMVNMASAAGRLAFPHRSPYAASKWAVVGLTKTLAAELGPDGVRVNAILPGIVRGARIENVIRGRAERSGASYEEEERRTLENVSLRRMVDPEEIAAMALFLASHGGRSITGQALSVCGNVEKM